MAFWSKKDEVKQVVARQPQAVPAPSPAQPGRVTPQPEVQPSSAAANAVSQKPEMAEGGGFALPLGKVRTAIGAGTSIRGRLSFDAPVQIDGRVQGEIFSSKPVIFGSSAIIEASVTAPEIKVLGQLSGKIQATDRIEIQPGARVSGTVITSRLMLCEGGWLDAVVAQSPDRASQLASRLTKSIEVTKGSDSRNGGSRESPIAPSSPGPEPVHIH